MSLEQSDVTTPFHAAAIDAGASEKSVTPYRRRALQVNDETALEHFNGVAGDLPQTPEHPLSGRGIVICAGGARYLPCAWVCINVLRQHGCILPIELWHIGRREMPEAMARMFEPLNVTCVDSEKVRKCYPARILNGWELKPYALIHSRFQEALLLDADNVAVADPTFLFDSEPYLHHGAIFWPDYGRMSPQRQIWNLTGVKFRWEREFETGQIVVNKSRCWPALALTMWMNEYSDFWYRHIHGDKETFHMAWRKLEQTYAMPNRGIHGLSGTMCQHDFAGQRLFQHRNMAKWSLGKNGKIAGFRLEEDCLKYLEEFRRHRRPLLGLPPMDPENEALLGGQLAEYRRVGHDAREISFEWDGTIGKGAARMERYWAVRKEESRMVLEIFGEKGLTASLARDPISEARWIGRWLKHERMPIIVTLKSPPSADRL